MESKLNDFDEKEYEAIFNKVFDQLEHLQYGIVKSNGRKLSSTVFWEAITVGAAEAIRSGHENLNLDNFYEWVAEEDFNKLVTGATNSARMISERINYAKEKFCS